MAASILVDERQWIVGGFEELAEHSDETRWRKWRDIYISTRMEQEVRDAIEECFSLTKSLVGDKDTSDGFNARLLFEEAAINLCGHGKKGLPTKPSEIRFSAHELDPRNQSYVFRLSMQDDAPILDLSTLPDPRWDERLEQVTGRGILLIRKKCRARIKQIEHPETGGKFVIFKWRKPSYSLADVGFPDEEDHEAVAG